MLVFACETSCDETSLCLLENKTIVKEQQTAVYREKINTNLNISKNIESIEIIDEFNIFGSSTLLFRYSALTFNGHKIHYDIDYTKIEEGHSGLLVHAPLQATYLLNIAKKNNIEFSSFEYKATFPLVSILDSQSVIPYF